jgi:hypothetical protein
VSSIDEGWVAEASTSVFSRTAVEEVFIARGDDFVTRLRNNREQCSEQMFGQAVSLNEKGASKWCMIERISIRTGFNWKQIEY